MEYVKVPLPSGGKLGYPDEIEIRPYKVREEKLVAAITGKRFNELVLKVFESVISTPMKFEDLSISDRNYILLWERVNSYFPDYRVAIRCPDCGKKSTISLDLQDLIVVPLPNYEEPVEIELKDKGEKIGLRVLRIKDEILVDRYLEDSKDPDIDDWVARYAASIVKNDLKTLGEKILYANDLSSKDFAEIRKFQEDYSHGVKNTIKYTCKDPRCGELNEITIPFNVQFFLPSLSERA